MKDTNKDKKSISKENNNVKNGKNKKVKLIIGATASVVVVAGVVAGITFKGNISKENKISQNNDNTTSIVSLENEVKNENMNEYNSAIKDEQPDVVEDSGYSNDELERMALDYYEKTNGERPGNVASEQDSSNSNIVNIQLYDSFEDHNSTSDWYTINKYTAKGTNLLGDQIDLTK